MGAGRREDRQSGTTGNHVLVSQGSPSICGVLPPSSRQLSDSFVAVFGQNKEDLSKCQLLTVSRSAYKTLVQERVRVNSAFARTTIDRQAVDSLPENGVPQQLIECGVHMAEVDKYTATRCGPGTCVIRSTPLEKKMMLQTRSAMPLATMATRRMLIKNRQSVLHNLLEIHRICSSISLKRLSAWIRRLHHTLYNTSLLAKLSWISCMML